MQIRSGIVAREFKSDDRPDLFVCGKSLPLEALKATVSIAAKHKQTFSIIGAPRAHVHAEAWRPMLVRLPVKDRVRADAGKMDY